MLKNLFLSKEQRFVKQLEFELSRYPFVCLNDINTPLPLEERYHIIESALRKGALEGFLIRGKKIYFVPITKNVVEQIRTKLKISGAVPLLELKQQLPLKDFLFNAVLRRIEKGFVGEKNYYSFTYVKNLLLDKLRNVEDHYDLTKISNSLGLAVDDIVSVVSNLIDDNDLDGLIRNNYEYFTVTHFKKLLSEHLNGLTNKTTEISFDELSQSLGVKEEVIEGLLVKIVEEDPSKYTLYPLEKKLLLKK